MTTTPRTTTDCARGGRLRPVGRWRKLRAKAEQQYTIPGTLRTGVAAETLRDWLLHYRRGRFRCPVPQDTRRPRSSAPAAG